MGLIHHLDLWATTALVGAFIAFGWYLEQRSSAAETPSPRRSGIR